MGAVNLLHYRGRPITDFFNQAGILRKFSSQEVYDFVLGR